MSVVHYSGSGQRPGNSQDLVTRVHARGWVRDASERRDFWHRIRVFPPEVVEWRKQLIRLVMENREVFQSVRPSAAYEEIRSLVDDGISYLREVTTILTTVYEIGSAASFKIGMDSPKRKGCAADSETGRLLVRLGPYHELGLNLEKLGRRQLRMVLPKLIPPNLRSSLSVSLLAHGESVCHKINPVCERCEIRNFCSRFRRSEAAKTQKSPGPVLVDLFAGAGGLSEGFTRAGFKVRLALDQDPVALKTYRLNHPAVPDDQLIRCDITKLRKGELSRLAGERNIDVLVGSPPCQGFSSAGFRCKSTKTGYRVAADKRNFLFQYMVSAAIELQPRLFLMENVPGMQSARHQNRSFLEAAARLLQGRGFKTTIWRLNASAFGVPQDRIRYFLVASSRDALPTSPPEEYQDIHRADFDVDALPPITVEEAIFGLPPLKAGCGSAISRWIPSDPMAVGAT